MTIKQITQAINKLKRPTNYMLIVAFLIAIVAFPDHMMKVASVLTQLPVWCGILFTSILGGHHVLRTYKKEIMQNKED